MEILAKMKDKRTILVAAILLVLFLSVLYIRALPLISLGTTDILNIVGSDDPLYNLRQIELVLNNYPHYAWFEAMTLYPTGMTVPWGPLFTWIGTTMVYITGASTRNEIIGVALWLPPILAALMVPLTFVLGRKVWNWKAGLVAAALIAVVGGQFFFRSLAGYLDHHIAEVLFSTLYAVAYVYAISKARNSSLDFKNFESLKIPILISGLAGVAYVLGFLVMPTMILFAFITSVTTIFLFIIEFFHKKPAEYLVLVNTVIFGIAAIVSLFFAFTTGGFGLTGYTFAHPVSYILIIVGTIILFLLSQYLKGKNPFLYTAVILALIFGTLIAMMVVLPGLFNTYFSGIEVFFGFNPYAATVQEARPWTLAEAWQVFNFGILLMIGGIVVLLYKAWKEYRPEHIFVLVWSLFIIIAAFRQVRYEYYLAVNIALLGGICVGYALERAWPDIKAMGKKAAVKEPKDEPKEEKGSAKKKKADKAAQKATQKGAPKPKVSYVNILVAGLICACALIFAVTSVQLQYAVASSGAIRMNQDWRESLEWMNAHTPETGVEYEILYDRDTFSYPETAYGVMSWWDYGHMITYIAKRIPNSNPFQAGVAGPNGSAAFFISQSEETTNQIAENQGTRYVITDIEMTAGKFWAMATWYNSTEKQGPYENIFLVPENSQGASSYSPVTVYTDKYFMTTIARLHNFDGSYTPAGQVYYIEYTTNSGIGPYPVITTATAMDAAQAKAAAEQYNQQAEPGTGAAAVSSLIIQPSIDVPALRHYRLVHESPTDVFAQASPDVRYVKVFEYVPGARIRGEGTIELPLVSNTGRSFVYRQASVNGEFIVPYSTEGNPYEVQATGKYRIAETGREFSVSEDAVMRGLQIS